MNPGISKPKDMRKIRQDQNIFYVTQGKKAHVRKKLFCK